MEENLAHFSLNAAILHQFSFLCPCAVLLWCPAAAASCSISCRAGSRRTAAVPHLGRLRWLLMLQESGSGRGWAWAPSSSGSSIPSQSIPKGCLSLLALSLGRAPCDGGLRLAGSCMFSLGERWEWRAAAGSTSAAGSADESHAVEGAETVSATITASLERRA